MHRTPQGKKQNHSDIPKKTSENKLKTTNMASVTYSITANPRQRATYDVGQK
jgi:hypothetical protein